MRMHSASSSGTSIVHGAVAPGSASAPTRRCAWARPADLADLLVDGPVPGRSQLGTLAGRLVANPPRRSVLVQRRSDPSGGLRRLEELGVVGPAEGLGGPVVDLDELEDLVGKVLAGGELAAAQHAAGQD